MGGMRTKMQYFKSVPGHWNILDYPHTFFAELQAEVSATSGAGLPTWWLHLQLTL